MNKPSSSHSLVTGFPNLLAEKLAKRLLENKRSHGLSLLVDTPHLEYARQIFSEDLARVRFLVGEVSRLHLGLSGSEYEQLRTEVTHLFHAAQLTNLSASKEEAWRVNVEGARHVLELARECVRLERLNYLSTCFVSGDRTGVIAEDELDMGQGFSNTFELTQFEAEKLAEKAKADLPISIYRPSNIVGDSRTGVIDRVEGPLYFSLQLITSPIALPLPLFGSASAPLHVVPSDFVVDAMMALSENPKAAGGTFHLVEVNPLSVRRFSELAAKKLGRPAPRFNISSRATDVLLGLPFLERWTRPQRVAVQYSQRMAFYSSSRALELLTKTNVRCPPLPTYLDALLGHFQSRQAPLGPHPTEDPLAFLDVASPPSSG